MRTTRASAHYVTGVLTHEASWPFDVTAVDTLQACPDALRDSNFDVILLALGLPDSSRRVETFSRTHETAPNVPPVILAVRDDDGLAIQAVHAGATAHRGCGPEIFLQKQNALVTILRSALSNSRLRPACPSF